MRIDHQKQLQLRTEKGEILTVTYCLFTHWREGRMRYGIAVRDRSGSVCVPDISTRRAYALGLLRRMAAGGVTSASAREIILDDLADERRR